MKKTICVALVLLALVFTKGCGSNGDSKAAVETPSSPKSISMPASADSYVGLNYEIVISQLMESGFTNVNSVEIADLTSDSSLSDGSVEAVAVDGNGDFSAGIEVLPEAEIVVTYHIIPKVKVPVSSGSLQELSFSELVEQLETAGFSNVKLEEEYDLDPDELERDSVNELQINGKKSFSDDDFFPFDADIIAICHYPYEKYTVQLHIDFLPNLIFSKYDVDCFIDGTKEFSMKHGEDVDYEFRVREGIYTLTFSNTDDQSGTVKKLLVQ